MCADQCAKVDDIVSVIWRLLDDVWWRQSHVSRLSPHGGRCRIRRTLWWLQWNKYTLVSDKKLKHHTETVRFSVSFGNVLAHKTPKFYATDLFPYYASFMFCIWPWKTFCTPFSAKKLEYWGSTMWKLFSEKFSDDIFSHRHVCDPLTFCNA